MRNTQQRPRKPYQSVAIRVFTLLLVLVSWTNPSASAEPATTATSADSLTDSQAPQQRRTISGRILLDGAVPPAQQIAPGRDICCINAKPTDRRVVVGEEGGLANVVVSIEPWWGEAIPPLPTGDKPPSKPVTLTNLGCAFVPRVAIVRVGQPLLLANDDPTMHNVAAQLTGADAFNLVLEPDGRRELRLAKSQRKPLPVGCNVHPFMRAWLFVRDDPYAAMTDESGKFQIANLPAGSWRVRFWHEGSALKDLQVGDLVTDQRGTLMVDVTDGSVDWGILRLPSEQLTRPTSTP